MPAFVSAFRLGLTDAETERIIALEDQDEMTEEEEAEYTQLEEKAYEYEDIMLRIEEGEEITPEEQNKLDEAMKPIFEKSWHLANYVKSLGRESRPQLRSVIRSYDPNILSVTCRD